ncbi:hypothetical protein TNCV_1297351 [Trichonephila clavipes]|nr:hypothetical protein TNCV_1297351 [Trichonephila clavipes]
MERNLAKENGETQQANINDENMQDYDDQQPSEKDIVQPEDTSNVLTEKCLENVGSSDDGVSGAAAPVNCSTGITNINHGVFASPAPTPGGHCSSFILILSGAAAPLPLLRELPKKKNKDDSLFLGIWTDTPSSNPYQKVYDVGHDES